MPNCTRLKKLDAKAADLFVCQLSTNDASQGKPLGSVSEFFEIEKFDTSTVAGAVEYIIAYAKQTWDCPVAFYTNPRYDSEAYAAMVELLAEIADKWDILVIDMWNDETFNLITDERRALYMADGIHPTQAGYLEWWTPYKARLYAAACGLYEGRLNGERIGDFVLAPGHTDYRKRVQAQTYDVTDLLRDGENELSFQLADGWYRGSCGAWGLKNQYGTETKLLAQLELTLADGTMQTVATDGTWAWSKTGAASSPPRRRIWPSSAIWPRSSAIRARAPATSTPPS